MIEKIKERARKRLAQNDGAHDYSHAERVANLAKVIQEQEGGDVLVISTASYMHDWCTNNGREYHVSEPALFKIRYELQCLGFPQDRLESVIEVIRHHENYDFQKRRQALSQECLILQDADRLDALGYIGIARCFYTSASLSCPFGTPEDMHELEEEYTVGQLTPAVQHFYTKLLHLKDNMNTEYAKKLAQRRHKVMVEFLEGFRLEWDGKQ